MRATTIALGCGCSITVEHLWGERLVFCPGHRKDDEVVCPGAVRHVVRAEELRSTMYTSRLMDPVTAEAEPA